MPDNKERIASLDYEQALTELQQVIQKLEEQEQTLEESLSLFEEGNLLIKRCAGLLEKAELRVQTLLSDTDDTKGETP